MNAGKTWLWSAVSSVAWCVLLTVAGVVVGENWEIVSSYLQAWGGVILGLMLLFALVQMLRYALSRKPSQESTE